MRHEVGIVDRFVIGDDELFKGGHEGFGDELTAVGAEFAAFVWDVGARDID